MKKRQLGKDGPNVPVIGLGTFPFSGSMGNVTDERSFRVIQRALDLGMTFIDTAEGYGRGRSETIIGRAMKNKRDKVFLATKVFGRPLNRQRIENAIHSSLLRLGTDYIDLYQIHWPDPSTPVEESIRVLDDLIRAGKVRHAGVSNFDVPLLKRAVSVRQIASNQMPYSLLDRQIENEVMPFCKENGIAIIPYSPLGKGLLTGKFNQKTSFPTTDARSRMNGFQTQDYESNLDVAKGIQTMAEEKGVRPSQIAIAWTLQREEVASCIPGATQPVQCDENAGAADITFTQKELTFLDDLSEGAPGGTEVRF
ncbi:MAG: aldo/keto reductase [SAR202 cluster bacterium]|nr:aldo/keto reductase [SAR202 cluster bacterium]|tara:strand:+ start:784 stop:1713 length:930 start_codon:yes stop_codon:yes gene_type:complete